MDNFPLLEYKTRVFLLDCIIITVLVVMCLNNTKQDNTTLSLRDMCFIFSFFTVIFVTCDIILRLSHWIAHVMEANTQSNDNISLLQDAFNFNQALIVLIAIILFVGLSLNINASPLTYVQNFNTLSCVPCILLSWILLRLFGFSTWDLYTGSFVESMKGLDYGTGMAYSYYYGYLRIILPSTGTTSKGLIEKMQNAEDNHNITFISDKLLLLIPSSSYIPPDLKEASYQWMESAINLETEQRDRAGVKRRNYHNNVYKIYPGGIKSNSTPLYVVAEGATPLLTFFEVQKHMHPEAKLYKKYHREIVRAFYKKLKELLNSDPECRDLCELIYYDDYDVNGTKVNIAEIILERISKIRNVGVN